MKQTLGLAQSLTLNQHMRQAIAMLGMSSAELDELVDEELCSNLAVKFVDEPSRLEETSAFEIAEDSCHEQHDFRHLLLEQVGLSAFNELERKIAYLLIHSLDDDGLLPDYDAVMAHIAEELDVFVEWIELVRARLMDLEPLGCCARTGFEAVTHQAKSLFGDEAAEIVERLNKQGHVQNNALPQSLRAQIRRLRPRPALGFAQPAFTKNFIEPDVLVKNDAQGWSVSLAREVSHKISLGALSQVRSRLDKLTGEHKRRAKQLYKAVLYREDSLLKVAKIIVEHQQSWFFKQGELQVLAQSEVASQAKMHESSVSRLVNANFLFCSRGTFSLKHFFCAAVDKNAHGAKHSAQNIKNIIKNLLANEGQIKPLSDRELQKMLAAKQIFISRRTVAKYRLQQHIPAAHLRKAGSRGQALAKDPD